MTEQFTLEAYYPEHEVPDHRVLLAFVNDDDAQAFRDWLREKGAEAFSEWLKYERR